jgi:hypothetical protein
LTSLQTALIALLVFGYMIYHQFVTRQVAWRDLLLPFIGAAYLSYGYLGHAGSVADIVMVIGGALFGVGTGLASATVVTIWRDGATSLVMQRGGWKYALVLLGLVVARILLRIAADTLKLDVSAAALNDAFIGMAVGNYAGRAALVSLRALALLGWDIGALPARRDVRASR